MNNKNIAKLGIAAGGCLFPPSPTTATEGKRIDESQNNKTVTVKPGENLVIHLRENAGSTGAKWRVTAKSRSLPPIAEKYIPSKGARIPGGTFGGVREFVLEIPAGDRPGGFGGGITIELMRGEQSLRTYTVQVQVSASKQRGTTRTITGTVENRSLFGPGGEAPPSGSWLKLDRAISVQGERVSAVFIRGKRLAKGTRASLVGKLELATWGGVTTRGGTYAQIVGATQVKAQSAS